MYLPHLRKIDSSFFVKDGSTPDRFRKIMNIFFCSNVTGMVRGLASCASEKRVQMWRCINRRGPGGWVNLRIFFFFAGSGIFSLHRCKLSCCALYRRRRTMPHGIDPFFFFFCWNTFHWHYRAGPVHQITSLHQNTIPSQCKWNVVWIHLLEYDVERWNYNNETDKPRCLITSKK